MNCFFSLLLLFSLSNAFCQQKFKIKSVDTPDGKTTYYMINKKGETIKKLDSEKYFISFDEDSYKGFAVFGIKGENDWFAIDSNEKKLFKVYNTSFGEPSPDKLIENKIRIVDDNGKIGFADSNGKIIIKPQFEIVTSFHKGKAIIGETCTKIPWNQHATEVDCHHYTIECKKQGYIDQNGTILEIGNFTFEEIQKKIKWKSELY